MYYSFLAKILRERTPTLEIIKLEPQLGVVYVSHNKMNYYVLESLIQTLEYLWFFFLIWTTIYSVVPWVLLRKLNSIQ